MHKYSSFPLAIVSWAHTGTASRLACCKIWRNISLVRGSRMHPSHYPWDPAFGSLSICVSRYYPVSQSFWTRTSLPFVKQHIVVNFPNSHISMWLLVVIFRSNLETLLFFFFLNSSATANMPWGLVPWIIQQSLNMQSVLRKSLVIIPGFVNISLSQQTVGSLEAHPGVRAVVRSLPPPERL